MSTQFIPYRPALKDPLWSLVMLRCTFDSNVFDGSDLSNDHRILGPQGGNVGHSPIQKKFGSFSMYSNGVPDNMIVVQSNATDTGPSGAFAANTEFCLEGWVYPTANKLQTAFGQYDGNSISTRNIHVGLTSGGKAYARITYNYGGTSDEILSDSTVSLNTWTHIACTRNSSAIRLFVNGVLQSATLTGFFTLAFVGDFNRLVLNGRRNETTRFDIWQGYIDDIRFTKGSNGSGACRYTTTFTPPASALPTN